MDLNNLKSDPIVVVGGGFGGLSTVQALLASSVDTSIILIDENSRFVFKPFLYELLSSELQLWEVAPLYSALASELGFIFLQDSVVVIDEQEQKLITLSNTEIKYSQLVIGTGVTTDYSIVKGLEKYAYGFSNLNDLFKIKDLLKSINNSSHSQHPLVISGAGPTGVELACKFSDLVNNQVEIYLVDKGNQILSKSRSFNREKALEAIAERNIKIYLNHYIESINKSSLELSTIEKNDTQKINYSGLVWTSGLKPLSSKLLDPFLDKKTNKVNINEYLQIDEYKNIFFVGDITLFDKDPFASSAQAANQQGFLVAQNINLLRKGLKLKSFEFVDLGEMLSLGIGNASLTGYGITLAGSLAFEIRRLAYLIRMPGVFLSFKSTGSWIISKKIMNSLFSQEL